MKRVSCSVRKVKIIEIYVILIFVATLFMGIGYAQISNIEPSIDGIIEGNPQDGVFIVDAISMNTENINSKVNYFTGALLDNTVVLDNLESTVTYQITMYNNTDKNQMFISAITDKSDINIYSNTNIEFLINGLEDYTTIISPHSSITFSITFKFIEGADVSKNTLKSKINFRFKEIPKILLSNENEIYAVEDVYPDYNPKEYEFTVSNYDQLETNNVPMKYSFEIVIDKPLVAKIYNENDEEITDFIDISGDGITQINHKYKLKIIWDDTYTEENILYNSYEYANKEFECLVKMKAIPKDDKYLEYSIEKGFECDIKSAQLFIETEIDDSDIHLDNNKAEFDFTIKNNNKNEYNIYNTKYKIILEDTEKFSLYVDDELAENNEAIKEISGNELKDDILKIKLVPKDGFTLDMNELAILKIELLSPYIKELTNEVIVIRDQNINPKITSGMIPIKYVNNQWVEADTTIPEDWFDYREQRWANVQTDNGYFVFVPRFAYKITSGYHTSQDIAGDIAIVFLNKDNTLKTKKDSAGNKVSQSDLITSDQVNSAEANIGLNATTKYIIHPAFTTLDTDENNVDGIWIAKYEMSMEKTSDGGTTWVDNPLTLESDSDILINNDSTKRMVSKPGVTSWTNITVKNIFTNCFYMDRTVDSHMTKNTEWGAAAYLSVSNYGKGSTNEPEQNASSNYITGCGLDGTISTGAASTTGNMYGIFDMAGGSYEYVAGYLNDTCAQVNGDVYADIESLVLAENRYKDVYEIRTFDDGSTSNAYADVYIENKLKVGDALWEISSNTAEPAWFEDEFYYVGMSYGGHYPVFDRGGNVEIKDNTRGIFYTGRNHGSKLKTVGFRTTICGQ